MWKFRGWVGREGHERAVYRGLGGVGVWVAVCIRGSSFLWGRGGVALSWFRGLVCCFCSGLSIIKGSRMVGVSSLFGSRTDRGLRKAVAVGAHLLC